MENRRSKTSGFQNREEQAFPITGSSKRKEVSYGKSSRKEEKKKGRETRNHKADIPIPSADAAGLYHIIYLYDYSVFRKYHGISELSADYGIFKVQMGGACQFQAHAAVARYGQNIPELVHHRSGETGTHDGAVHILRHSFK